MLQSLLFKGVKLFDSGVLLLKLRPGEPKGGVELAMDLSDAVLNSMPDETFSGNLSWLGHRELWMVDYLMHQFSLLS